MLILTSDNLAVGVLLVYNQWLCIEVRARVSLNTFVDAARGHIHHSGQDAHCCKGKYQKK